jgi:hypothetical protein
MNVLQEAGYINCWSKNKVDESLDEDGSLMATVIEVDADRNIRVDNEVYGNKAMLYFYCEDGLMAKRVSGLMLSIGGNPNFRWNPDNPACFEMQVSYFKGRRWWE